MTKREKIRQALHLAATGDCPPEYEGIVNEESWLDCSQCIFGKRQNCWAGFLDKMDIVKAQAQRYLDRYHSIETIFEELL